MSDRADGLAGLLATPYERATVAEHEIVERLLNRLPTDQWRALRHVIADRVRDLEDKLAMSEAHHRSALDEAESWESVATEREATILDLRRQLAEAPARADGAS